LQRPAIASFKSNNLQLTFKEETNVLYKESVRTAQ